MDPVSAIANGVGQLSNAFATIIGGKQQLKLSESQSDQALNSFILSQQQAQQQSQQWILAGMIFALISLVVLVAYTKK